METKPLYNNLKPQGFTGVIDVDKTNLPAVDPYTITGTLNTDGEKKLISVSGNVKKGDVQVCNFSGNKQFVPEGQGRLVYEFREIPDTEDAQAIVGAVKAAIKAIQAELEKED